MITTSDASVLVALAGVAGVALGKAFDYAIAKFSKNPPDNGAFRDYLLGQVKSLREEVGRLSEHVLDCETDRAAMRRQILELKSDNQQLRARLGLPTD